MDDGQSLLGRITDARASKDLNALHRLLSEVSAGKAIPPPQDMYGVSKAIRDLKGLLEHTDTRGWKKSGRITREDIVLLCRKALERMDMESAARTGDRMAFGHGLKKINTGAFPARIRERNGK